MDHRGAMLKVAAGTDKRRLGVGAQLRLSVIAEGVSFGFRGLHQLVRSPPPISANALSHFFGSLFFRSTGHRPKAPCFRKTAKASPEAQLIAAVSPVEELTPLLHQPNRPERNLNYP